jgi:hypothetical protein
MGSVESIRTPEPLFASPKERARKNLIQDYGMSIDKYLKKIEEENRI